MKHDDEGVEHVSAVLVVDDHPRCDVSAAKLLIAFAMPEVRALSRRRTLDQVRDTLLWCAFAWNHGARSTAQEALSLLESQHGTELSDYVAHLFRRRSMERGRANATPIGPIRVSRLRSGAVAVHVDTHVDTKEELERTVGAGQDLMPMRQ